MSRPDRLIVSWRASIEAAARRADIAIAGPYTQDDTVHHRRVGTLKVLARTNPTKHQAILHHIDLFDRATIRANEPDIHQRGTELVACWEAAASR